MCQSVTILSNNYVSNNLTFSLAISAGSRTAVVAARSISYFTIINTNGKLYLFTHTLVNNILGENIFKVFILMMQL